MDVKFDGDPAITTASHISTAGTTILTTTGSLMSKADMIGVVDDDDDDMADQTSSGMSHNGGGITLRSTRSRVGVVMDDDDDNDQNTSRQATSVLVRKFAI